ncbi:MAG: FAD-dependent oxidoreductase [Anaerolineae bacterium]
MRDVVIVGGGLSGLAAAHELERLKVPYRLIEVKKRLGGSIASEQRDGFVLDSSTFAFAQDEDWAFLKELGLEDALCPAHDSHRRTLVAVQRGTQSGLDKLAQPLKGTIIHRMAVSSLGQLNRRFTICLENGLMWDAAALIVAAPARHTERMFRTLAPEFSLGLLDYGYDAITRVSLGYRQDDLLHEPRFPWDVAVSYYYWTNDPSRVPDGHLMLQVGIRVPPRLAAPEGLLREIQQQLKAKAEPVVTRFDYWEDADPCRPTAATFTPRWWRWKPCCRPAWRWRAAIITGWRWQTASDQESGPRNGLLSISVDELYQLRKVKAQWFAEFILLSHVPDSGVYFRRHCIPPPVGKFAVQPNVFIAGR